MGHKTMNVKSKKGKRNLDSGLSLKSYGAEPEEKDDEGVAEEAHERRMCMCCIISRYF